MELKEIAIVTNKSDVVCLCFKKEDNIVVPHVKKVYFENYETFTDDLDSKVKVVEFIEKSLDNKMLSNSLETAIGFVRLRIFENTCVRIPNKIMVSAELLSKLQMLDGFERCDCAFENSPIFKVGTYNEMEVLVVNFSKPNIVVGYYSDNMFSGIGISVIDNKISCAIMNDSLISCCELN